MNAELAVVRRQTSIGASVGKTARFWPWVCFIAALAIAELTVSTGSPQLGMGIHLVLLIALPLRASFAPAEQRPLLLALMLGPMVRVVSLALPLSVLSPIYWYALTSLPLFVALAVVVRLIGLSRQEVGLRIGSLSLQFAIALLGFPLGVLEYLILAPAPIISELTWQAAFFPVVILLVSTGLLEEMVFRGVLQTLASRLFGAFRGVVYVSVVFAVLHIGYLSAANLVFVFGVALLFGWLVRRTGSLLGVSLAHGLTNIVLLLVLPLAAAQVTQGVESGPATAQPSEAAQQNAHPTAALEVAVAPPAVLGPVAEAVLVPAVASSASQREDRAAIPQATTGGGEPAPAAPGLHLVASEPEPASLMQDGALEEARADQAGDPIYHRIQSGDTLTAIASRWGTSIEALVQHNAIRDRNLIYSGWLLLIPKSEGNQ
jgi:hypothetical protein